MGEVERLQSELEGYQELYRGMKEKKDLYWKTIRNLIRVWTMSEAVAMESCGPLLEEAFDEARAVLKEEE